jgi:hypothetical protein
MHLPEMRLPPFDRNIEHWSAFYNTFTSTMNKYHYLTPIQKFHYLRTAPTREAAACVNSLSFNEENYPKTMDLLKQRYDCPQVIVSCHGIAIIDHPELTKCSPTISRNLTNTVRQNIGALNSLGEPTNANSLILELVSSKLPNNVRQQWELTLTNKEVPQYTDLLNCLENLALACISPSETTQTRRSQE